jgi:hypothetical protein
MGWFSRGPDTGNHYTPHKPWALVEYKSGGGLPKRIELYASQEAAARELRANIGQEGTSHRHVFVIHHLSGPWGLRFIFHTTMPRSEYRRIAIIQYRAANAHRGIQPHASRARQTRRR